MELTTSEELDNLEILKDLDFFRFFWKKYHDSSSVRLPRHRERLNALLLSKDPVLCKDDLRTIELFVDFLDREIFPKFKWLEDGSTALHNDPLLDRLKSIVVELTTKYNRLH